LREYRGVMPGTTRHGIGQIAQSKHGALQTCIHQGRWRIAHPAEIETHAVLPRNALGRGMRLGGNLIHQDIR
jgi:hypothetical protein